MKFENWIINLVWNVGHEDHKDLYTDLYGCCDDVQLILPKCYFLSKLVNVVHFKCQWFK